MGDPDARAMACHTLEAIPIAMSSTTQLRFSCPKPPFLDDQCYRCSAAMLPLMPSLNVVCTIPSVLLECLCLLMPPPVLAASSTAASPAFTSSKHSPISCHHQALSESTGAKLYFFERSSCPMITMGIVAPPVCLMPYKCCPFPLQKQIFFFSQILPLFSLLLFIHLLCVWRRRQQRNTTAFQSLCSVMN